MTAPIACSLPNKALRARKAALRDGLVKAILATNQLEDGVEFALPASAAEDAQAFVEFERSCCGAASYKLRPDDDRVWVEIRGPAGTAERFTQAVEPAKKPQKKRSWLKVLGAISVGVLFIVCAAEAIAISAAVGLAAIVRRWWRKYSAA